MKITNKSKQLIDFFKNNGILKNESLTNNTKDILKQFYNLLTDAFDFVKTINKSVSLKIEKINNFRNIPRPSSFPATAFPESVRTHIETMSSSIFVYSLRIYDRNISIIFVTELTNPEIHVKTYNKYFQFLLVWLYIINEFSLEKCASELKVYIYHTTLLKQLPNTNNIVLDEVNVNTAFTRTCPVNSEIIIFRKEEWFKVFIHETMHNFGLDFSDLNNNDCNKKMLSLFNVKSDVNLYEAYTEFWARTINVIFCSFVSSKSFQIFEKTFENLMNIEIGYSCFQMIKVLKHMKLDYVSLLSKPEAKNLYKERTSVLSYYIITFVLIYNYQDFLLWCETNNSEILSFKKTSKSMLDFCRFIEEKYRKKDLLQFIKMVENNVVTNNGNSSNVNKFINNNLRMTLCELG